MRDHPARPRENAAVRLLIVDDEADIRLALQRILSLKGHIAEEARSGHEALSLLERRSFDLMVLDMWMPGLNGLELMRRVRQTYPELLIIILTGHATLESAIEAAKTEAVVDYLQKPASHQKIIETVERALQERAKRLSHRRLIEAASEVLDTMRHEASSCPAVRSDTSASQFASVAEPSQRTIHHPPLLLDREKRLVKVKNDPTQLVKLSKGEAAVLASLMAQPNRVLSCGELVRAAWGYDTVQAEAKNAIRRYISRLRHKLEADPKEPRLIHTVRRRGYRFVATQ